MLNIATFDQRAGGNVLYKALAHPLAANGVLAVYAELHAVGGPVALYDPDGIADALLGLHPGAPAFEGLYVRDSEAVGRERAGMAARPLTALAASGARAVLVAAFDAGRALSHIAHLFPDGARVLTLDRAKLPDALRTNRQRYLDKLNFATNFAFFRDQDGLSTRLVTSNYWSGYGAGPVSLWLRLFDERGHALATWTQDAPGGPGGIAIDSRAVRTRFGLPEFTGQLFVHAIGVAGHDVVKYALDTYASGNGSSLSCTHDANAWPSDRYAGLPAPRADERVTLWLQNSHSSPIPAGTVALDRMGRERPVTLDVDVPPFATMALDVGKLLPDAAWPDQVELRAGRHMVRPRYEVTRAGRTRIAHVNVERADLKPEPAIAKLPEGLGRGFLLPFPVLDRARFRTIVQPTPMALSHADLPLRLDVFDEAGTLVAERFLGKLPRDHACALDLGDLPGVGAGHAELVYDFRDGGGADGWMHTLVRYEHRASDHVAETSFGAHIFNTAMTFRDEPQSYSGPPPGLTTRLFLRLGDARRRSFAVLIYPASAKWRPTSDTRLILRDGEGEVVTEQSVGIACSGSQTIWPHAIFDEDAMERAGPLGHVVVRDETCRLFGYHGLMDGGPDGAGSFSLDHMFGF